MPLWRCPHCGTPQVESSRCWVCRRSTTSCAACTHFRRGIAGGLGLCGLDPRRVPLRGTEMLTCWVAADTTGVLGGLDDPPDDPARVMVLAGPAASAASGSRVGRTFVPIESLAAAGPSQAAGVIAAAGEPVPAPVIRARRIPGGWSLWGDFEP
ncbi:MAG: hypothetical protein Q8M74_02430 [Chloroflexota bacterium]|nr:hypothetical protein [Chloroflexota bacterium]